MTFRDNTVKEVVLIHGEFESESGPRLEAFHPTRSNP